MQLSPTKALYRSIFSVLCLLQRVHMSGCDMPRGKCSSKASRAGGQLSIVQFICVNKYLRHLSALLCGQVLSYTRTSKCSIISKSSVEISLDRHSLVKISVSLLEKSSMLSMQFLCHAQETEIPHHIQSSHTIK